MTEPAAGAPQSGEQTEQPSTPPWGDDFDPQRAWNTIQKLREREKELAARPALTDEHKQQLAEAEKLRKANQTEAQRTAEELSRWQSEAEKWRGMSVTSRIEAIAAGSEFADPSDAVSALAEKAPNYLDAGGQIDEKAIRDDLKALLERKPHWRRQDGTPTTPRVPAPNRAQGAGNGSAASTPAAEFGALIQSALNRG